MFTTSFQKVSSRLLMLILLQVLFGGLSSSAVAVTPPGTIIDNQATGTFLDPIENIVKDTESNSVQLVVAEIAGVTVTPAGVTGQTITGGVAYFDFLVTNVGNDPTQFFIPGTAGVTGGTIGTIQIIAVDPDGAGPSAPLTLPGGAVTVPVAGGTTGSLITLPKGAVQTGGTVKVRVPVTVTAASGSVVTVILGDTASNDNTANTQNQPYLLSGTAGRDLYTQDNVDPSADVPQPTDVPNEAGGIPLNGDVTNHRQEASALQTLTAQAPQVISGKVFEDVNYGGGAGRSLTASGGIPRPNVTIELYDSTEAYKGSTTTDTNGAYSFSIANITGGIVAGDYHVRVVNSTVTSARPGAVNTLIPVQTYRTDAGLTAGTVTDVPNRVGGEKPNEIDAPANTTSQTLSALSSGTNQEAQSITNVKVGSGSITGVDFGFNFDTIVNTNNSGQGSLSQFITNSNALANTGLDQVPNPNPAPGTTAIDPAPGQETSIFMIPATVLNSNGVADIKITSLLPQIIGTNANNTVIDGRTQTANIGNTNNVNLGIGGTVGVDALPLSKLNGPEIQITGLNSLNNGIDIQANNVTVTGTSILGFGPISSLANLGNIMIGSTTNNPTGTVITGNVIGTVANSFIDLGAGTRSGDYGIYSYSTTGTFTKNLIGFNGRGGIEITNGSSGILIEDNEVRGNSILDSTGDGTNIISGGGVTVRGNLFTQGGGTGIDTSGSTGNNIYVNNTVTNNGLNLAGQTNNQTSGFRMQGSGSIIDRNIIANNNGAGILVRDTASTLTITKNSIYGNGTIGSTPSGQIGIDLIATGENGDRGTGPYVTFNDGTTTTGGNQLLDYPVFTNSAISGSNLVLKGYARSGARIELFIADPDPSGFGEGKTYLTTLTEGSGADTDSTTGSYSGIVNGINQGSDSNASKFTFTIPLASLPGVVRGTKLTATSTISNATSEFSGVATVGNRPNMLLVKRITAINGNSTNNPNDNTPLNTFVDNTTTTADNDPNWPSNYLLGESTGGKVKLGDEIEYTIYYLNQGDNPATLVKICDLLAPNLVFNPSAFGSNIGFQLKLGSSPTQSLTSANDPTIDRAQYLNAPFVSLSGCNSPSNPTNASGAVVLDLNSASATDPSIPINLVTIPGATSSTPIPNNSYGWIRFKAKVK